MKLKLELSELRVESFATVSGDNAKGTVLGHLVPPSAPEGTCVQTCTPLYTQPHTCKWTCNDDTCGACPTGPNDPGCNPPDVTWETECWCDLT